MKKCRLHHVNIRSVINGRIVMLEVGQQLWEPVCRFRGQSCLPRNERSLEDWVRNHIGDCWSLGCIVTHTSSDQVD